MDSKSLIIAGTLVTLFICVPVSKPQQPDENRKCEVPIFKGRDADRKTKIVAKPEPEFSRQERRAYAYREITLRAILCGSGEVMEISIKSGIAPEVDEKAVAAAKKIKFVAGENDGKPISTLVTLIYRVK